MDSMNGKYEEPDDVSIPVIEIVPGWAADSMTSLEDCEDAHIKCMALCAEIEFQIDMFDAKPQIERDYSWLARAKRALKYKKLAAQIVSNCRGRIAKAERQAKQDTLERRLIDLLKAHVEPALYSKCVKLAELAAAEAVDA
jgi:hypothetical protein